ncbi:MAG: TonB-dependent receptor [Marinifilaceae bacterium]|jgi:hypothetical protein|nr:TonB-dependent receptor [Marinifilaceae bacterium]
MKILSVVYKSLCLFVILLIHNSSFSSNEHLFQNIRGVVKDKDSGMPVIGANVVILNTNPLLAASTDANGRFVIDKVPIGRYSIMVSCIGYKSKNILNQNIGSAKELLLSIKLEESFVKLDEIRVKAKVEKTEPLNKMSLVSSKLFTVDETKRYAGALNDPARLVSSFAGVSGDPEGNNEIIVRGNSPRGVQWRLEGIDIPNPNHFAQEGTSGGPINALNSNMLSNSDFLTGAFAAEYGNAYSGIFDMKMRNGNSSKSENSFGISTLGAELTSEGPVAKNYYGSYIINARYSSLGLMDKIGIIDYSGIPIYSDISFKLNLPSKKIGSFNLVALLGTNSMYIKEHEDEDDDNTPVIGKHKIKGGLSVFILNHRFQLSNSSYFKNSISYCFDKNSTDRFYKDYNSNVLYNSFTEEMENSSIKYLTEFNSKLNRKNTIKLGAEYNFMFYDMIRSTDYLNSGSRNYSVDDNGDSFLMKAYVNWKHRFSEKFSLVAGSHSSYFKQTDEFVVEPRLGLNYMFSSKNSLSLAFGLHSKLASLSTYNVKLDNEKAAYLPNKNLKSTKAEHYVLSYSRKLTANINLKLETYLQKLYDIPVENDINSRITLLDLMEGVAEYDFVNKGTGKNYGLELSLERFFVDNYYFLFTASLYESKFKALDKVERDSRYNANYIFNFLWGKEFKLGDSNQNIFSINSKLLYAGGQYYTPVNLEESLKYGKEIVDEDNLFNKQADDVFSLNLSMSYIINKKNKRHELKLEVKNITNNKAKLKERYDEVRRKIDISEQLPILPSIYYVMYF